MSVVEAVTSWSDLPLDSRLLEAVADLEWASPTAVQSTCIPLALKGKDISIQSRTGSGKTGAFVIPALQRIATEREKGTASGGSSGTPFALILVPSVELCEQTVESVEALSKYMKPRIVVENLTSGGPVSAARVQSAHIVVSTAALLAKSCRSNLVDATMLQSLRYFVLDEADMIASMAEISLRTVQSVLPTNMQVVLASATLTEGVATLKGQLLRSPVNVVLTSEEVREPAPKSSGKSKESPVAEARVVVKDPLKVTLSQFYLVATDECHSHTLLYGLYRLNLIKGKTLIFVEEDDQTYRLQHFLEQMGIATLSYDANLPMNVRLDALKRFQSGEVATLVCTDGTLESATQLQMSLTTGEESGNGEKKKGQKRKRSGQGNDAAPSALHRGVDFSKVANVIVFDGVKSTDPIALSRYTHRIGRAGRAGCPGLAISIFSVPQAKKYLRPLKNYCRSKGEKVIPFRAMQRAEAAKLQYRVDGVLGNITRTGTRKLRVATVAAELSRSSYLSNHLSQRDTDALKRVMGRSSKKVKVQRDVLDVPEYMKVKQVEDVTTYTRRVHANQTRASKLKKAARKETMDPLKKAVSKLRSSHRKM